MSYVSQFTHLQIKVESLGEYEDLSTLPEILQLLSMVMGIINPMIK